jgi:Fibronectin type III domain
MDWLILILGVPAILIPLVLLFGFAGCVTPASLCTDDSDCPVGTQCVDGLCVAPPPLSAPENLTATALDDHSVALTWTSDDPAGTEFQIERMQEDGERFEPIPAPEDLSATGATDASGLQEGVTYLYRVRALLDGEDSGPSDIASATTFTVAFTGTLTEDAPGFEGFCVVQRLSRNLLTAGGTQVRIVLRGSTAGSLTLDRVTISQPDAAVTSDPFDAAADLTDVASNVIIPPNTAVTVPPNGPVNYTLDPTNDLLVAFDISNTTGEGNLRVTAPGALTGGDTFSKPATVEAGRRDRGGTTGYPNHAPNNLALVEKIMVL